MGLLKNDTSFMIRIANAQGFWGDSLEAPLEQLRGGPIDYLTLDYLAEVTMSILQKQFSRDPQSGYARDFVQMIERGAKEIVERNVKVVANAPACKAPCSAPAAPPSLCSSSTMGNAPQMFFFPSERHWSAHSAIGDEGVMG